MKIYFIRHNFNQREIINPILEKQKRIAIHFNDEEYTELEQFSNSAKTNKFLNAWKWFSELRQNAGIVVAQYQSNYCYIGRVKPNTQVVFLDELKTEGLYGYKTLKMVSPQKVDYCQFPLLSAIRPMYSTISPIAERNYDYIMYAYEKEDLKFDLKNMHYKIQEQMCEEWLRSEICPQEYRIKYCLLKTGEYMEALDIYGRTYSGKKLFAQVTFAKGRKAKKKKETLMTFASSNSIKIMFSTEDETIAKSDHGIINISLLKVWEELSRNKKYNKMLKEMIGLLKG